MASEYQKQAHAFLEKHNITFATRLIGSDCPRFCEDALKGIDMDKTETFPRKTHIHGKHYRCTFNRQAGKQEDRHTGILQLSVDFWNSYNDEEFNFLLKSQYRPSVPDRVFYKHGFKEGSLGFRIANNKIRTPTAYDVLAAISKYEPGTFEDFCGDFGYDTHSQRAKQTYEAVRDEWIRVSRFFTTEELAEIQEIN